MRGIAGYGFAKNKANFGRLGGEVRMALTAGGVGGILAGRGELVKGMLSHER